MVLLKKYPKSSSEKSLMTAPLIKRQLPNEMICDPFGPMKLIYTLKKTLVVAIKIKVVSYLQSSYFLAKVRYI